MKKISWMIAPIMTLLFASIAMAESYTVKRGDVLSKIASRHGVTAEEIQAVNPKISNIHNIHPGWQLQIPISGSVSVKQEKSARKSKVVQGGPAWVNTGVDVYKGGLYEALTILDYDVDAKVGLANAVMKGEHTFAIINHISRGGLVVADDGSKYKMVRMLGGGGNGRRIKIIGGQDGVIANWRDKNKNEAGKIYSFGNEYFMTALICNNPTLLVKVQDAPGKSVESIIGEHFKEAEMVDEIIPADLSLIIPALEVDGERKSKILDRWDGYVGGGDYRSRIDGSDNHGKYWWMKYRNRPMWYALEENSLGVKNVGLGFVAFLSGGDGVAAKYYDYQHNMLALGGTAKVYTDKSDYDFDVMLGRQWSKGSWMSVDANEQVTDSLMLSAHGNLYFDTEYFHKSEVNADVRIPFNTNVKKGEKSNNFTLEATYTQWITKYGDSAFTVAPGFNAGVGYEGGAEHKNSVKFGPAVEFSSYNNVIGGLSLFNYKVQGSGQWHPVGGYVSFDGINDAWKAAHITGLSDEELQNLEGSKLLSNPADFL